MKFCDNILTFLIKGITFFFIFILYLAKGIK